MEINNYISDSVRKQYKTNMFEQRFYTHATRATISPLEDIIDITRYSYIFDFINEYIIPELSKNTLTIDDIDEIFERIKQDDVPSLMFGILTNENLIKVFSVFYNIITNKDEHDEYYAEIHAMLLSVLGNRQFTLSENISEKIQDTLITISNFVLVYVYTYIVLTDIADDSNSISIMLEQFNDDFPLLYFMLTRIIENIDIITTSFNEGVITNNADFDYIYELLYYVIDTIDNSFIPLLIIGILIYFGIYPDYLIENTCNECNLPYNIIREQLYVFGRYDPTETTLFDLYVNVSDVQISFISISDFIHNIQYYIFIMLFLCISDVREQLDNELEQPTEEDILDKTITNITNEYLEKTTLYNWFISLLSQQQKDQNE